MSKLETPILPYPKQNKEENFLWGMYALDGFCKLNKIPLPKIIKNHNLKSYGVYVSGQSSITINPKKTRTPVDKPGFAWSFTGYKADLTIAGVMAHETGHYVDYHLNWISDNLNVKKEPKVSSYEPNKKEVFAEMMKLFILNPDLLKQGRPLRWKFLTENLGFQPFITDKWENILKNANPKIISAAKNWIKLGNKIKK